MAYAKVQGATEAGAASSGTSATSNALPSTPTSGNLLIAAIAINNGGVSGFTPPSGWTTIFFNQDASGVYHAIVAKISAGTETSGLAFSWTGSGFWAIAGPYEFSGGPSSLTGIVESAVTASATGNSSGPSVTGAAATSNGNELLIGLFSRVSKNALSAGPTDSFTLDDDVQSTGGTASTAAGTSFAHKILTANETPTVGITLSNTREWNASVIALVAGSGGGSAPTNTVAPAVTGTTVVGNALSTTNGTWTGSPTGYSYQWQRDNFGGGSYSNISGATSSSYTLVDADDGCNVRCVVTATNGSGSTPANSNSVGTITEPAPTNSVAPVASGTATVGNALSTTNGTWAHMGGHGPSYSYQWQRDNQGGGVYSNISGATSSSYTLADADDACNLRCVVTATNDGGNASANSNSKGTVVEPAPTNSVAPAASPSSPTVGSAESVTTGTWAHMGGYNATYSYQWQTSPDGSTGWTSIVGATGASYSPVSGDLGNYLRCVVTAHNTGSP